MKIILILSLIASLASSQQRSTSADIPPVLITGLEPEYKGFDEIKATLVNKGEAPVYLPGNDCGEAQVIRFNEVWGRWLSGISSTCEKNEAIEIKPRESYHFPPLKWRPAVNSKRDPIESNSMPGRYKIEVRYSLEPYKWGAPERPRLKRTWTAASPEFRIVR